MMRKSNQQGRFLLIILNACDANYKVVIGCQEQLE